MRAGDLKRRLLQRGISRLAHSTEPSSHPVVREAFQGKCYVAPRTHYARAPVYRVIRLLARNAFVATPLLSLCSATIHASKHPSCHNAALPVIGAVAGGLLRQRG
jgi:hypothetical protein